MTEPFHLVLFEPEIPPNTGNAMRLAANTGAVLHLVEPLGFDMDDARLRRAGMDYRDRAVVRIHPDFDTFVTAVRPRRLFAIAKSGRRRHTDVDHRLGDAYVFGKESTGLGADLLADPRFEDTVTIPMRPGVRSLNLSNAVAIVAYEAWRTLGFPGAES